MRVFLSHMFISMHNTDCLKTTNFRILTSCSVWDDGGRLCGDHLPVVFLSLVCHVSSGTHRYLTTC